MKWLKYYILFLFVMLQTFAASHVFAQRARSIDSLRMLAREVPDTMKPYIYNKIAWQARYMLPIVAIQYSTQAADMAMKFGIYKELVKSYNYLGVIHRNIGKYEEAIHYYEIGLNAAVEYKIRDQEAFGYNNLANIYYMLGNYPKANEYVKQCIWNGEQLENNEVLGYGYLTMGLIYSDQGFYQEASECFKKSARYRKTVNLNQMFVSLKNLALVYVKIGKTAEAKDLYYTYLNYSGAGSEYVNIADLYHKLALIYYNEHQIDSALYCGKKSLEAAKLGGFRESSDAAYRILSKIYLAKGDVKRSAYYHHDQLLTHDSIYQASLASKIEDLKLTEDYFENELELAKLEFDLRFQIILISVLIFVLGIVIGISVFLGRKYSKVRKLNIEFLSQQNAMNVRIRYAQKIQSALLPSKQSFGKFFSDKFLLFRPQNVVSGDFYWHYDDEYYEMLVVADCTGHGVPGATMSMIGMSSLQEIALSGERRASEILERLRKMVKDILHQNDMTKGQMDGMDIGLMVINKQTYVLEYSGAFIPLYYIRNNEFCQLKATRNPVGVYIKERPFVSEQLQLKYGDCLYLSTDGFVSQFSGFTNVKMSSQAYKDLLMEIHLLPMNTQLEIMKSYYINWQGPAEQTDDVLVAGWRL